MITGALLFLLYGIISFIVGLLPAISFPVSFTTAIQATWYYVNAYSFLLPMSTILSVLGIALTFHVVLMLWRLAHLVGGYLRGK